MPTRVSWPIGPIISTRPMPVQLLGRKRGVRARRLSLLERLVDAEDVSPGVGEREPPPTGVLVQLDHDSTPGLSGLESSRTFPECHADVADANKIVITEACLASAVAGHVAIGHGKDRGVERIDERDRPMSRDADLLEEVKLPTRSGRQDP